MDGGSLLISIGKLVCETWQAARNTKQLKQDCEQLGSCVRRAGDVLMGLAISFMARNSDEPMLACLQSIQQLVDDTRQLVERCGAAGLVRMMVCAGDLRADLLHVSRALHSELACIPLDELEATPKQRADMAAVLLDLQGVQFPRLMLLEEHAEQFRCLWHDIKHGHLANHIVIEDELQELLEELLAIGEEVGVPLDGSLQAELSNLRKSVAAMQAEGALQEKHVQDIMALLTMDDMMMCDGGSHAGSLMLCEPPPDLLCPISLSLMTDPVMVVESEQVYDRQSILDWCKDGGIRDPLTQKPFQQVPPMVVPVHGLRRLAEDYRRGTLGSTITGGSSRSTTSWSHSSSRMHLPGASVGPMGQDSPALSAKSASVSAHLLSSMESVSPMKQQAGPKAAEQEPRQRAEPPTTPPPAEPLSPAAHPRTPAAQAGTLGAQAGTAGALADVSLPASPPPLPPGFYWKSGAQAGLGSAADTVSPPATPAPSAGGRSWQGSDGTPPRPGVVDTVSPPATPAPSAGGRSWQGSDGTPPRPGTVDALASSMEDVGLYPVGTSSPAAQRRQSEAAGQPSWGRSHMEITEPRQPATASTRSSATRSSATRSSATQLVQALLACQLEHVRHMLAQNGMPNAEVTQEDCAHPLHWAAKMGDLDVGKVLLTMAAWEVSAVDSKGWTPLHVAAWHGRTAMVQLLLRSNADPNAKSKKTGETPLHRAAARGHIAVCEALLKEGANKRIENKWLRTPKHEAFERGHHELAIMLQPPCKEEPRWKQVLKTMYM